MGILVEYASDVSLREDREIADLGDVAAEEFPTGSISRVRTKRSSEIGDKGSFETRAGAKEDAKRVLVLWTEGALNIGDVRERR